MSESDKQAAWQGQTRPQDTPAVGQPIDKSAVPAGTPEKTKDAAKGPPKPE